MSPMNRRLSRRAFIAGGVGVAGSAAIGGWWLRSRGSTSSPAPLPTASSTVAASPAGSAVPSATPTPAGPSRGELRAPARRTLGIDTFDAARSGERSLGEILDFTHSRLVAWEDTATARLAGDLASHWEQADPLTVVFTLAPGALWHERPDLPARPVLASDVASHLDRVASLARDGQLPRVQRAWDYRTIARIEATAGDTVVVHLAAPDPFLLQTLAGPFAFIQRPEAVPLLEADGNRLQTDRLSGSGPFVLDRQDEQGDLLFAAAPAGHTPPRLAVLRLRRAGTSLDAFLARELDEFVARDRRDAGRARSVAGLVERSVLEPASLVSSFHTGSAPWANDNLRLATSAALNRRELARRLFGGRAVPAGIIPPSAAAFARSPAELARFPGYRESYADDVAEARARFAAADAPPGPLRLDVPVILDPLYALSDVVPGMLRDALGVEVTVRPDSYVNIARRVTVGEYGNGEFAFWLGWGPPAVLPDPSRALRETFHSSSATAAEAGFRDADIDRRLDALVVEFDLDARRALAHEVEAELLASAAGGIIPWLQQRHEVFRQPYVDAPDPDAYGLAATARRVAVDTSHPAYPSTRRS